MTCAKRYFKLHATKHLLQKKKCTVLLRATSYNQPFCRLRTISFGKFLWCSAVFVLPTSFLTVHVLGFSLLAGRLRLSLLKVSGFTFLGGLIFQQGVYVLGCLLPSLSRMRCVCYTASVCPNTVEVSLKFFKNAMTILVDLVFTVFYICFILLSGCFHIFWFALSLFLLHMVQRDKNCVLLALASVQYKSLFVYDTVCIGFPGTTSASGRASAGVKVGVAACIRTPARIIFPTRTRRKDSPDGGSLGERALKSQVPR